MRRTQGQSERQVERQTRTALAVLLGLLAAFFAGALAADVATRSPAGWLALLVVLGALAIGAAARLLARLPAEMRSLAGERRRVLDDLLRSEEIERERIAAELHDDMIQVIIAALVTIDRVTPALRAHDTERIAETLPPARKMLAAAVERVRRLTFDLHPPLLDTDGALSRARRPDRPRRPGRTHRDRRGRRGRPLPVRRRGPDLPRGPRGDRRCTRTRRHHARRGRRPRAPWRGPRTGVGRRTSRPAGRRTGRGCSVTGASSSSASGCGSPTATSTSSRPPAAARSWRFGCRSPTRRRW